jgi:hypothetical protein
VAADAAGCPYRDGDRGVGEEMLQQHVRCQLADATAAFATARDQTVDAARDRIVRFLAIIHFGDDATARDLLRIPRRFVREHDRRHAGRKLIQIDGTSRRHAHAPRFFRPAVRLRQRRARSRGVAAKIEDA